ncbi:malate dehydrogenase (oxaloacetate-decarboxylating) [Atopostipes suicloacalis DSM 15692]|uniref:Malate dehydrogenase (Oxaloacetate-decarboxylating) n=1 Tax=Atopostipes suicloacalis DSM 15692 TaxID=1121025 RepID=A0A1M4YCF7_9LACT|nr:NADP-dependent malic enzyme [Atopostipes suicloacalis]SHF03379.1 malate dehydrogenase (oxaloacetate-decarboxylating) [Atopostipes suicloacalis DSM 15692]
MTNEESEALKKHHEWNGKIEVISRAPVTSREDLALAYTPGVADACMAIVENPEEAYRVTRKNNLVGVITNGSAVLGLGNIGPQAAMPVMEGKSILFKEFADVDAFPISIESTDVDEVVQTVKQIAGSFGAINLEDIAAPECFEIERRLIETLDIPVFHDDQHGTAIVVGAAVINALKLLKNKRIEEIKIVINGAGAAGIAIAKHLMILGAKNILLVDREGIIHSGYPSLNSEQKRMLEVTNIKDERGNLQEALVDAEVFVGVSAPNILSARDIEQMDENPIVFAMANPIPEIMPDVAKKAGVTVMGTGRSDFPNQINNVSAFPGIFKGALEAKATEIDENMRLAASYAIANLVEDEELSEEYIIPDPLDKRVVPAVAEAVKKAAINSGVVR